MRSRQRSGGDIDGLTQRVLGEIVSNKICLEQRAHLRIARARMVQDEEVNLESYHVYDNRGYNETSNTGTPMPELVPLRTRG